MCWRDSLFDLTLVKHYRGLFWARPQPWPINIWTNSWKRLPWDGPNSSYSVCLWKLKSTIYYLFQATSAEGAPLSQSLGWQEPNFDNSQLTNPDGFHRDQLLPKIPAFCNFHFLNCAKVSNIPKLSILSFSLKKKKKKQFAAKSLQSCSTLCDPIDGSPPCSPSLGFSRQEYWSGLPFLSSKQQFTSAQIEPSSLLWK